MAAVDGCMAKTKTPLIEERKCPVCGRMIEVYTVVGRVREDAACECGYVIRKEEPYDPVKNQEKRARSEA